MLGMSATIVALRVIDVLPAGWGIVGAAVAAAAFAVNVIQRRALVSRLAAATRSLKAAESELSAASKAAAHARLGQRPN